MSKMTETAEFPGTCFFCGKPIYTGDVIVRSTSGAVPVAGHAACDPDFSVGGCSPAESPRGAPIIKCEKCVELARLLIECKDALPAISMASAKLHGIRLDLADRIEAALKPWEITE